MTIFLSIAITSAPEPFLTRLASSRSVPSRTPCRPFSMPQCARANPSSPLGPIRSRSRLVIPKMTCVSTFSPILRSRVSRKTCAQPSQSDRRYSASADVTSMLRFSTRPCPLSFSDARSISDSRRAAWRGGKTGLWLGEDGRDIRQQRRLVFLDRQDVISPSLDDLNTNVAMRKHCITGDDLALNWQYPEQFQSGFVFVRLGVHS